MKNRINNLINMICILKDYSYKNINKIIKRKPITSIDNIANNLNGNSNLDCESNNDVVSVSNSNNTVINGIFKFVVSANTNIGLCRENNEDTIYVNKQIITDYIELETTQPFQVFAVMDGMGGEEYGEVASRIAAELIEETEDKFVSLEDKTTDSIKNIFNEFAMKSNDTIVRKMRELMANNGGTTFSGIIINYDQVIPVNIGDSRVYYFENGVLNCLTKDQTLAQLKLDANMYNEHDSNYEKDSHVLTSYLGVDKQCNSISMQFSNTVPLKSGTVFIIASDGLTDLCSDKEINDICLLDKFNAKSFVDMAIEKGGVDNISVIVIKVS